ncbi:hypothetical protein BJX99DRAFT_229453, partial [Aspergillus californicus]
AYDTKKKKKSVKLAALTLIRANSSYGMRVSAALLCRLFTVAFLARNPAPMIWWSQRWNMAWHSAPVRPLFGIDEALLAYQCLEARLFKILVSNDAGLIQ